MPKVPSALYNHATRDATARQLNISTSSTGRSLLSWRSSQVPLQPPVPLAQSTSEYYVADDMDIDDEVPANPVDEDERPQTIEVMPGVLVQPKLKAKRYENSVCVSPFVFPPSSAD